MIPLSIPNISGREWKYLKECLDTNWVSSSGSFVKEFEVAVSNYVRAKYAVSCINGTSGLFVSLKLSGVGANDEVIVPTITFIAPVNTVRYLGAEPIFMDCDEHMNLDGEKVRDFCKRECTYTKKGLKNKKSNRLIKAILPVHVFGNPCNMELIMEIAKRYDLKVIEDATESMGSFYTQGAYKDKFTGTVGDFGVYSFNGNKIITTGGGGMIIVKNKALAERAKYLTEQAKDNALRHIHNNVGYNFRLTNLQAAVGLAQLEKIENFIAVKKRNYETYQKGLQGLSGLKILGPPQGTRPNYWFYSLLVEKNREDLMRHLLKEGIQTRPVWRLNHLQMPYRKNWAFKIEMAIWFSKTVLNIPCSSNLSQREVSRVLAEIKKWKN